MVGFAFGICHSKFHKAVLDFAERNLPDGKPVFFLNTYSAAKGSYAKVIAEAVSKHPAKVVGQFGCLGFDTFGTFKLIGGIGANGSGKCPQVL